MSPAQKFHIVDKLIRLGVITTPEEMIMAYDDKWVIPNNIYFDEAGSIFIRECDCGAVATHGKDAPKRVHAHWCSTNE